MQEGKGEVEEEEVEEEEGQRGDAGGEEGRRRG